MSPAALPSGPRLGRGRLDLHDLEVPEVSVLPFAIGSFETIGPLALADFPHRQKFSEIVLVTAALLDFWQADDGGTYDDSGFTFRGHQFTDSQGRFSLTTIVPGRYPGRTRHIHVKVQAPGQPILTTQLYFPGVPQNSSDTIFDPRLLTAVTPNGSGEAAVFDFLLDVDQNPGPPPPPPPPPPGGSWVPNHAYSAGDVVTYGGSTYVCIQGHTSQSGWEPPNVSALWRRQ